MWTRGELKQRGMAAFKANYWKCVLVAFLLLVISGGISGGSSRANFNKDDFSDIVEQFSGKDESNSGSGHDLEIDSDYDSDYDSDSVAQNHRDDKGDSDSMPKTAVVIIVLIVVFIVITCLVIGFALNAFLLNPVRLGCNRFFVRNLEGEGELNHLSAGFDTNYKNVVKVMFFKDLYIFLWMLIPIAGLFIAIVKGYEYRMIPYLLGDDPNMDKDEAFARTKEMMTGQKWNAFVLDLSFIGWQLLSAITLGILGIFYVAPYIQSTNAALYDTLDGGSRAAGGDYYTGYPTGGGDYYGGYTQNDQMTNYGA